MEHLLEILTSGGIGIDGIEQVRVLSISENDICPKDKLPFERNLSPPSQASRRIS